jgi:flagellar basal body-associated protein FliL
MTWTMLLVLALIIIIAIAAIPVFKIRQDEYRRTGKYPKGHYMGMGMAIGMGAGVALGVAIGNIALGPALGLPIGVAIGAAMEQRHADELRPLTEKEQKLQRLAIIGGVVLLVAGVAVFFVTTRLAGG